MGCKYCKLEIGHQVLFINVVCAVCGAKQKGLLTTYMGFTVNLQKHAFALQGRPFTCPKCGHTESVGYQPCGDAGIAVSTSVDVPEEAKAR